MPQRIIPNNVYPNVDPNQGCVMMYYRVLSCIKWSLCLATDGMNVMEGVKGLSGFADFLLKIHDEDPEKRDQMLEWARNRGWNPDWIPEHTRM